ncbi:uncharacterized protein LOC119338552 [Triticum dicoccoides]|uniref:uncharacterized protein LOC119338552 n=1 Tax=Triticum dicoccoides TaxID=85692 RepID=UPI000E7CAEBD|nr:uncharacterized protein LOC119338552 [Triticum dicoccoides]
MMVARASAASGGEVVNDQVLERKRVDFVSGEGRGDRDGAEQRMGQATNFTSFHSSPPDCQRSKRVVRDQLRAFVVVAPSLPALPLPWLPSQISPSPSLAIFCPCYSSSCSVCSSVLQAPLFVPAYVLMLPLSWSRYIHALGYVQLASFHLPNSCLMLLLRARTPLHLHCFHNSSKSLVLQFKPVLVRSREEANLFIHTCLKSVSFSNRYFHCASIPGFQHPLPPTRSLTRGSLVATMSYHKECLEGVESSEFSIGPPSTLEDV